MRRNYRDTFEGVIEDIDDPLMMHRVRVRVFAFHDNDKNKIPTEAFLGFHHYLHLIVAKVPFQMLVIGFLFIFQIQNQHNMDMLWVLFQELYPKKKCLNW